MVFFEKQATTFSLLVAATLTTLGSYQASAQTWQKSVSADVQRARCQKLGSSRILVGKRSGMMAFRPCDTNGF
jgi:hypothetical protein